MVEQQWAPGEIALRRIEAIEKRPFCCLLVDKLTRSHAQ